MADSHDNESHSNCTRHEFDYSRDQAFASIIGYSIVGIVGVIGNTIVIIVFSGTRDRTLKFLVFALALADLTSCGVVLPLDLIRLYRKDIEEEVFHLDHNFADAVVCIRNTVFAVDGTVLFLVALDRYWCICRPTKGRLVTGPFIATLVILLGGMILTAEVSVTGIHLMTNITCENVEIMRNALMSIFVLLSLLAMLILAFFYSRILCVVLKQDTKNLSRRRTSYDFSLRSQPSVRSRRFLSFRSKDSNSLRSHVGGDDAASSIRSKRFFSFRSKDSSSIRSRQPNDGQSPGNATLDPPATLSPNSCRVSRRGEKVAAGTPRRSRRTALMLFGSTLVFYGTLMPIILSHLGLINEGPHHKLYYLNNAMNVILYSALNPNFRKETRKRFSRCCQGRQQQQKD